jgi:hypothetical protein
MGNRVSYGCPALRLLWAECFRHVLLLSAPCVSNALHCDRMLVGRLITALFPLWTLSP